MSHLISIIFNFLSSVAGKTVLEFEVLIHYCLMITFQNNTRDDLKFERMDQILSLQKSAFIGTNGLVNFI